MKRLPVKLPLFAVISVVFTLQLLRVSGFVAYTTYQTGKTSLIEITEELIHATFDQVEKHLYEFLELPHRINDMNSDFIRQNSFKFNNTGILEDRFLTQVRFFKTEVHLRISCSLPSPVAELVKA